MEPPARIAAPHAAPIILAIFAHNEAGRIRACLASLPLDRPDTHIHLLVNGSSDDTAAIAREIASRNPALTVHELQQGGKARTWNHFIHNILVDPLPGTIVFMDGDAEIREGSLDALAARLDAEPRANTVAGLPLNGRKARYYQAMLREEGGLFGDLYALRGAFVERVRVLRLRLPDDLIGDDGLVAAWAATNLGTDDQWDRTRMTHADGAGFLCEPVSLFSPTSWRLQYKRMISYAVRHFQGRIISDIMGREGPPGLPARLADLYGAWLPRLSPRGGLVNGWFDRRALAKMKRAPKG